LSPCLPGLHRTAPTDSARHHERPVVSADTSNRSACRSPALTQRTAGHKLEGQVGNLAVWSRLQPMSKKLRWRWKAEGQNLTPCPGVQKSFQRRVMDVEDVLLGAVCGAGVMPAGQADELALRSSKLGERRSSEGKNTTHV